ncbi:MAG: hypothetical protein IJS65_00945 [Clostridia bacterium]|nr:hypothetical protein [Clostridia bacterium]
MNIENLKETVVDAPTLFVGVGGTGSRIVQRVAEMCGETEVENISFVCLDTNVNDLKNVDNSRAKLYAVQTSTTQTVGDYLDYDTDALKNWFPKNSVMYDKTVSEGAGQVRAISRLALNSTIKTGAIKPLYDAIDELFRKDGKSLKQALRVSIVSTASGGTGSGILLPLSMVIRDYVKNKYPQTGTLVRAMVLLPETLDSVIKSAVERDSQRRNAYATVKELNAFMMKGSGFCDIDGEFKRYGDLHIDVPVPGTNNRKSLSILPCDFCFLLDGQNSEDNTLVNVKQYEKQAALALYEQNIGPMHKDAFSVEDNIIKELSNPGNMGRNRFGGIGASALRYPYERIAEYISYGWALDAIGGTGEAGKWTKYDKEFEIKRKEARKKGMSLSEGPFIEDVYNETLLNSTDNFSKDIVAKYGLAEDLPDMINAYIEALKEKVDRTVMENRSIKNAESAVHKYAGTVDFENNQKNRQSIGSDLNNLRNLQKCVTDFTESAAKSAAESIFRNDTKTINAKEPYTIEYLLHTADGADVCHPNAARFVLYNLKKIFDERIEDLKGDVLNPTAKFAAFQKGANDLKYDVAKTRGEKETDLDAYVQTGLKLYGEQYNEGYHSELLKYFKGYYNAIVKYCKAKAEYEAFKEGKAYVESLCEGYERFYATFPVKVAALERKREGIIDELAFVKGDSVLNVCSSGAMLKELALSTKNQSAEGALLSPELNARIFDAVKENIAFEREIENESIVEEDKRIDIFDKILLGYFKDKVISDCKAIDVNIIDAIAMENRLLARIKAREKQNATAKDGKKGQIFDNVTHAENERYIRKIIAKGARLASPGIQSIKNEEPRTVECCAYNESLRDMRNYRIDDLIEMSNKRAVDTVSRYELHFFNALYNLTPDKLKKFAASFETETGVKSAGLYHTAYISYSRNIGPDSTKDMMLSTHIDKRWDSIANMPELDFGFQRRQMMRIHKALVYALVLGAVSYRPLSTEQGSKKVYRYENSDERVVDLIVSNGTPCDEFYEILDALYISSAVVSDIDVIKDLRSKKDTVKNSSYSVTAFARGLKEFKIAAEGYDAAKVERSSVFEIPLLYYNTLPNSRRYIDEITDVIEAVIDTLREEVYKWEKPTDARFIFCRELVAQFDLFAENYGKNSVVNAGLTLPEDPVVDIIYRKIKAVLSQDPEPEDLDGIIEGMKKKIR